MKKIVILGVLGMAGHIMAEYLNSLNKYKIYGIARKKDMKFVSKEIDVRDFNLFKKYLSYVNPDLVINCIGILVSKSNNEIATAIQINSYLPHFLSELGNELNYKLIHISTDCVFSGKVGGYKEYSFKDGNDNYSRTKALGEIINDRDLTIRTSIIGPELKINGTGLLNWFLKVRQDSLIEGFSKAYWSGVTTLELAKQMEEFIEQDIKGLYHLCVEDKISKYDLLKECKKVWNKNIQISKNSNYKVDKSLICERGDFKYKNCRPEIKNMLVEIKEWMDKYSNCYKHYKV